jgi:potassium efflux system protein
MESLALARRDGLGRAVLKILLALLPLLLCPIPPAAEAQTSALVAPQESNRSKLDAARATLDQIESSLVRADLSETTLQSLGAQISPISATAQAILDELSPRLALVKTRLDQLGSRPDDRAPPETPSIAAERADQESAFQDLDELVKRSRGLQVQAEQIQATIGARRRELFTRATFERSPSILSPNLWLDVAQEFPRDIAAARLIAGDWLTSARLKLGGLHAALLAAILAGIAALYLPLLRLATRVMQRDPTLESPTRLQKAAAAVWVAGITAMLPLLALVAVKAIFDDFGLLSPRLAPIGRAIMVGAMRISVAMGIARGLLAPGLPNWRLLNLSDRVVDHLQRLVIAVAVAMSVMKLLEGVNDVIAANLPVSIATRGVGALIIALIMASSLKGLVGDSEDEPVPVPVNGVVARDWYGPMRLAAWATILVITASVLVGYIAFGAFLVDQIAVITGVGSVLYLLLVLSDEAASVSFSPQTSLGRALMASVGLRRESLEQIGILLSGAAGVLLVLTAVVLILAPWGIESNDMVSYLQAVYFGIKVGDVTVSLSSIIVALLLFCLCFIVTRGVQRWLEVRFLPHTQLDTGLRNAIKTSLGYIGIFFAAALALSHLGLSFDRLAIVAGALSVGIGFGLQSIVNNFVSGLIILWERAIRVGDWIVVGEEQGYVRRINVRSTEIETFDRATVIVPNSNLVAGIVKNWVRTDRVGRIKIPVNVPFDADPTLVRDTLVGLAKGHDFVLSIPAPIVFFLGFGEFALQFELICFVDDVETATRIKSDLNFEILAKLKEAGIAVPYPHRDIRIIGLERLESLLDSKASSSEAATTPLKRPGAPPGRF